MASYLDLFGLWSDSDLQDKLKVASTKKAQSLLDKATPTTNEVKWAANALQNPEGVSIELLRYLIAKNSDSTVSTILSASDGTMQTQVDAAADALIAEGLV